MDEENFPDIRNKNPLTRDGYRYPLTINKGHPFMPLDEYEALVDEVDSIIVERGHNAAMEIIAGYYEVGQRLLSIKESSQEDSFKTIIEMVQQSLIMRGRSLGRTALYDAIKFYKLTGNLSLTEWLDSKGYGKNVKFKDIRTKYLYPNQHGKRYNEAAQARRDERRKVALRFSERHIGASWTPTQHKALEELIRAIE